MLFLCSESGGDLAVLALLVSLFMVSKTEMPPLLSLRSKTKVLLFLRAGLAGVDIAVLASKAVLLLCFLRS